MVTLRAFMLTDDTGPVPGNAAALACYRAAGFAGFARLDPATEERWNRGQPRPYVWMAPA